MEVSRDRQEVDVTERAGQLAELRTSLGRQPPEIPSKFLYDARGSELFEEITELPEYYPTRCERELLRAEASKILTASGGEVSQIIELGSGAAKKILPLLHAILGHGRMPRYLAVDISAQALEQTRRLLEREPGVQVSLLRTDYGRALDFPPRKGSGTRLVAFLGGTLGNENDASAIELLSRVRGQLESGDALLLGASLVANPESIVAAYNDTAGVTAAFNKNVLAAVNELSGSAFRLDDFEHRAIWNAADRRIEMWLSARRDVRVDLGDIGGTLRLAKGEGIRTEISRRFTFSELDGLLAASGFAPAAAYASEDLRFGLVLGRVHTLH